jgi:hypothetical protein
LQSFVLQILIGTQKEKEKEKKPKQNKEVQEKEYVCWLFFVAFFFFFFGWRVFQQEKNWVLLHFSCFTKFLAQNCHP